MNVKRESVYDIQVATDERRGGNFCYTTNETLGLELARGKGWYGSNGSSNDKKDVLTFELDGEEYSFLLKSRIHVIRKREDYEERLKKQLIESALSKLSTAEKKALGY